jgi:hypothetical protein
MRAPVKEYDFSPLNLPQELLSAIGLMTASAAQTESIVEMAIHGCLGLDFEYGMAVTTHMAMPQRFSALKASAEIRIDDLDVLDELDVIISEIDSAFILRNAIVHHVWCRDPLTDELFTIKNSARASVKTDLIPMTVDNVKRDALLVCQAGLRLMKFLTAYSLTPKLPDTDRPRGHKSAPARKKRRENLLRGKPLASS